MEVELLYKVNAFFFLGVHKCIFFLYLFSSLLSSNLVVHVLPFSLYMSKGFSPICITSMSIENFDLPKYINIFACIFCARKVRITDVDCLLEILPTG